MDRFCENLVFGDPCLNRLACPARRRGVDSAAIYLAG